MLCLRIIHTLIPINQPRVLALQFEDVEATVAVLVGGGPRPNIDLALRGAQTALDALHTAGRPPLPGAQPATEPAKPGVTVQVRATGCLPPMKGWGCLCILSIVSSRPLSAFLPFYMLKLPPL